VLLPPAFGGVAALWFPGCWYKGVAFGLLLVVLYLLWRLLRVELWLRSPAAPLPQVDGVPGAVADLMLMRQHRSRQRAARLSAVLKRFRQSSELSPDAAVLLVRGDLIEWMNPAARTLLGLQHRDLGRPLLNLLRHPRLDDYLNERLFAREIELPSPLGDGRMLSFRLAAYGQDRRLLMVRDVTQMQRLIDMRQDFVANVSHELRTPLTVLTGYLEMLDEPEQALDADQARMVRHMRNQAQRMGRIVEDLLLLARLETSAVEEEQFEQVDVAALIDAVRQDAGVLVLDKQQYLELDVDPDWRLRGVALELYSAFANLVFNAIKYTPAQGRIRVRWHRRVRPEPQLVFSVEDTGIGIEPRHIPRLTERFYRVDVGRSRAEGGTGLGLAIVKHVMLRHQAQLEVQSEPGRGSLFSCVFPGRLAVETKAVEAEPLARE